jgi:hypothetical protein
MGMTHLLLYGEAGELDSRRVDDLIVWLYWLIEEGKAAPRPA